HPDGHADDHRRPDGGIDLRPTDGDGRRARGRQGRTGQPPVLLFLADSDAPVLRVHRVPRAHRKPDLRHLLPDREEVGELGGVTSAAHASALQPGRKTMNGTNPRIQLSRRRLLTTTATGVAALSLGVGALLPRAAQAVTGTVRWVSPRGTIEVLD